jgi:hypothetical protein
MVQRLGHDAGHACVDDRCWAARLAYKDITYEFSHVKRYRRIEWTVRV